MSKTVLSVDDSRSIRDMISLTLEASGYRVLQAEDGQDGLRVLGANRVDMVITDLNMPKMNGIEMTQAIRADSRYDGLPIVLLTTEGRKEKMIEGKKAGATGWLVKPFDETKIRTIVQKMIG